MGHLFKEKKGHGPVELGKILLYIIIALVMFRLGMKGIGMHPAFMVVFSVFLVVAEIVAFVMG
ncbi:hypothetical protein J4460_05000 [Candidatus Woesearchaeota archaeon]|nr:hypothetical protein [Candidatus Woesearchaeota archaeon]OGW44978.1 MAG: hypothetical protein A2X57_04875 [Nitrospirae bacterium GWD2_57_8]HIH38045.1 hypothetical protein [Candidatus Woesearchaeota archaeon]HIH48564.1 hypothetical protein [Candidatus Woesearchaeota archaeon]HIJ04255.1 hypothetical protein [Candidatus Woesearchaeota archaeon]